MRQISAGDLEHVLSLVTGTGPEALAATLGRKGGASACWASEAAKILNKTLQGMPLAYAMGGITFMGRWFKSDGRACAIRPYTEAFARAVLKKRSLTRRRVLDVGCGAGAVIISIALESPGGSFTATDIDPSALELARENADAYGAPVTFLRADLFDGVEGQYAAIVANLPYEKEAAGGVQSEEDCEPRVAIFDSSAEEFGVQIRCLREGLAHLAEDGRFYLDLPDTPRCHELFRGSPLTWGPAGEFVGLEMSASDVAETLRRWDEGIGGRAHAPTRPESDE